MEVKSRSLKDIWNPSVTVLSLSPMTISSKSMFTRTIRVSRSRKASTYGSLSRMKIDNMREEHHERLIQNASNVAQTPDAPAEAKKKPGCR